MPYRRECPPVTPINWYLFPDFGPVTKKDVRVSGSYVVGEAVNDLQRPAVNWRPDRQLLAVGVNRRLVKDRSLSLPAAKLKQASQPVESLLNCFAGAVDRRSDSTIRPPSAARNQLDGCTAPSVCPRARTRLDSGPVVMAAVAFGRHRPLDSHALMRSYRYTGSSTTIAAVEDDECRKCVYDCHSAVILNSVTTTYTKTDTITAITE